MKLPKVFEGRRRKLFAWLVLNGLIQAVLGLVAVFAFERFHASGFSEGAPVIVLMAVAAGLYVSRVLQRRHGEMFALDYVNETRLALLEKLLSLADNARGASIGLVTARLSNDLLALKSWLSDGLANSIVQCMTLLALLAGSAFLYPQVAIVLACVVLPWLLAVILLRPALRQAIAAARRQRGRLAVTAGDQVITRLTLAHFGRTTSALNAVSRRAASLTRELIRRATLSEAMRAAPEWALPIAALAALWLFGGGASAPPAAAPLLLLLGMTGTLLAGLSRAIDLEVAHRLAAERFSATFEAPGIDPSAAAEPCSLKRGKPAEMVLQWTGADGVVSVSSVPPGAVLSLAGGTAEQRSGVLAAIARLRDDPHLAASLAGQTARQISIRDWRRLVTLASPRLPLVRDTIAANLAIGAPSDTEDAAVLDLARQFGIVSAPEELQQQVEPLLVPVPQALAMRLCRALMRNASVILLDEVTAASDFALIERFLGLAKKRRITIVTSGCVLDGTGAPIGEPLSLTFDRDPPASPDNAVPVQSGSSQSQSQEALDIVD